MSNTIESEGFARLMSNYLTSNYFDIEDAYSAIVAHIDKDRAELQARIAELEALRASPVYGRVLKADAERIVAATVEVCANECEREMMFPGGRQLSYAHHGVHAAAQGIRAITPEQILSGLAASQQMADRIADGGTTIDAQSGEKQ